jgi:histidinol-phosphatase (PHP family)
MTMPTPAVPSSIRMPPDLHIHTPYSRHAQGTMEEAVRAAVSKGLTEIGFSDHFPYPEGFVEPAPDCVIPNHREFAQYVNQTLRLRDAYAGRLTVRLGVEIDYLPGHMDAIFAQLASYPLDYVIGSIHIVDGVAIDYRPEVLALRLNDLGGPDGLWTKYWAAMEVFLSDGGFDIVGHLDLPKKFRVAWTRQRHTESIDRVLGVIQRRGLALEINTGGWDRADGKECYPSEDILRQAIAKGIPVSFGSDAHRPEDVGRHFTKAADLVRRLGGGGHVTFREGRMERPSGD